MKNLLIVSVLILMCGFAFMGFSTPEKAEMPTLVYYEVSELELLHSVSTITSHDSYSKIKRLSDSELKNACISPENNDYVTIRKGSKTLMNGNTRVYELKRRGILDFKVPCDVYDSGNPKDYGFYDL